MPAARPKKETVDETTEEDELPKTKRKYVLHRAFPGLSLPFPPALPHTSLFPSNRHALHPC
jgi:hypothetical protein